MAMSINNAGSDRARSAAIVEDGGGFRERETFVCALDEDFDGGGAGAGGEFLVFFGEFVPVVAFGCEEGGGLVGCFERRDRVLDGGLEGGWTTYCLGV
jgi:hypothetical protein